MERYPETSSKSSLNVVIGQTWIVELVSTLSWENQMLPKYLLLITIFSTSHAVMVICNSGHSFYGYKIWLVEHASCEY